MYRIFPEADGTNLATLLNIFSSMNCVFAIKDIYNLQIENNLLNWRNNILKQKLYSIYQNAQSQHKQ